MKRALNAQEMRTVDAASADHSVPAAVLMENAGEAIAQEALRQAAPDGRFLVLCGLGNNGGDGLVAARKLAGQGRVVMVELLGVADGLEGEPARNMKALKASGLSVAPIPDDFAVGLGDVVVDALLGTGLTRDPEGKYAEAIGRISSWRASGAKVVAADLPSGLNGNTGVAMAPCVSADVTLSFGFLKVGQALEPGASRCGELKVVDIGIPRAAHGVLRDPGIYLLEESDVRGRIPEPKPDAYKGTFGHVLVVAGSWGKIGAGALAGLGALRAGTGLVTIATRPEVLVPVMAHAPELMGVELVNEGPLGLADLNKLLEAAEGKQAVVIGPGIARGEGTPKLLSALLEELTIPCVMDADALNAVAEDPTTLQKAKGDLLLTPHPGEMGRLLGLSAGDVQKDRIGAARVLAREQQVVVVLKGARTVIAREDGAVFINPTGNVGMATAGTGDVLSGILGALLARGLSSEDAAVTGVYVHGLAGDLAAKRTGKMGLLASDLLDGLGEVWTRWGK